MNKERSNRRRKLPHRIYAFLLVCVMVYTTLSGIQTAEVQVQAVPAATISGTSWVEVTASDWATLKTYLQDASHNYKITLSSNIDETPVDNFYKIVAKIQGNKFLELNGHDITLQANKDDHEKMNYLFESCTMHHRFFIVIFLIRFSENTHPLDLDILRCMLIGDKCIIMFDHN